MESLLKLLLFFTLPALIIVAGYKINKYFNAKIIAASRGTTLLTYVLLMIGSNIVLLLGGVFLLFYGYEFFSA